jgi:hypothetical protein
MKYDIGELDLNLYMVSILIQIIANSEHFT